MIRMRIRQSNRGFRATIRKRVREWSGKRLSARIVVPPELKWWYWQEFGTAAQGDTERGASGHNYIITPVEEAALSFPTPEGQQVRMAVSHPGIRPHRMITKVLDEILSIAAYNLFAALQDTNFSFEGVRQNLLEQTMPTALDKITLSIMLELPGVRMDTNNPKQDGKLHGRAAADVFEENAQIRNTGN